MNWMPFAITVIVIYAVALLFIFSYSLVQLNLVISYLRNKKAEKNIIAKSEEESDENLPSVTIQLPVYNEMYVVKRLLKSVASIDYPKDKLEIQILDDSEDETVEILAKEIQRLQREGLNISHIRRTDRSGFKAGALAYGLNLTKGSLITIFDADFLPKKDFLKKTVSVFKNEKVGVVQTRWGHVNEDYSLLTKLQAFGLDAHFSVEQKGRNAAGYFINFNGTSGIWRKSCIVDAGGWASDTLTEDLDLSYRAQLKGWKFVFLEEVSSPAELPVTISALKNQQYRWNKGAAECAKKNLPKVLRDRNLSLGQKLHAAFHLMNSTIFIAIMITALLSVPVLIIKHEFMQMRMIFWFASFFLAGFAILGIFYFTAFMQFEKSFPKNIWKFVQLFPLFLSISMGLALHNAIAVIEGYAGRKTSFIRTPKFNILSSNDKWKSNKYLREGITWLTLIEGVLAVYFGYGTLLGFHLHDYGLMPFHLMLAFGFATVFFLSFTHTFRSLRFLNDENPAKKVALGV